MHLDEGPFGLSNIDVYAARAECAGEVYKKPLRCDVGSTFIRLDDSRGYLVADAVCRSVITTEAQEWLMHLALLTVHFEEGGE